MPKTTTTKGQIRSSEIQKRTIGLDKGGRSVQNNNKQSIHI